ncbi:MAG: urea ABC transporter permease subunit UrtB [Inquilinaceae bacterium]
MRVLRTVAVLAMLVAASVPAASPRAVAQTFDERVAALAEGSFADKAKAVEDLAATGDERAGPVLQALLDGDLYVRKEDGMVVVGRRADGLYALRDPVAGADLDPVGSRDVEKIRINNRLRGAIRGALGGLTLLNADPDRRRAAADAVFVAAAPDMLPILEDALAREQDPGARRAMERARGAVLLAVAETPEQRLAAVTALSAFYDPAVKSLLQGARNDLGNPATGSSIDPDGAVAAAIDTAMAGIDRRLALLSLVESAFQGLSLGSVLLLAAIGLAITFGVMGVINMAHGEMVMLGAYTTFVVQEVFRGYAPGAFGTSLFVAVPLAFCVAGLAGIAIERGVIRFLYGRPLETLLATWGISLILQQLVRTVFGPTNRQVGTPAWMSGSTEITAGLSLTNNRLAIIVFALMVFVALILFIRRSAFGLQMRAVTQNRAMAGSMGIRTGWVDAMTFGLGSGIAGIAGVALSQIDNVSPNLGQAYIIDSFMVVVFGGVGNLWGTLVAALSLGVANKFIEPYTGAVLGKILILVAIILFIQRRPRGLFALRGRSVEA